MTSSDATAALMVSVTRIAAAWIDGLLHSAPSFLTAKQMRADTEDSATRPRKVIGEGLGQDGGYSGGQFLPASASVNALLISTNVEAALQCELADGIL